MHFLRKVALFIITPVFSLALFLLLISFVIVSFFGTPKPIKDTLVKSHVYDHMVSAALDKVTEESQKNNNSQQQNQMDSHMQQGIQPGIPQPNMNQNMEKSEDDGGDINFDAPEIQSAASKAFTPDFLRTSVESVVDGVYGWLDGKTAEPQFTIDISSAKKTFVESVADSAATRVEALPVCTTIEQAQGGDDPFSATCKPPDFNAQTEKQKFLEKFNSGEGPLKQNAISYADLQKDSNEKPTDKLKDAPKFFQLAKELPVILAVVAIVLMSLIVLLNPANRFRGIRTISWVFFTVGTFVLVITVVLSFASTKIVGNLTATDPLQHDLINGSQAVAQTIRNSLAIGAIVYILIGIVGWFIVHKHEKPLSAEQKENNINKVLHTKQLDDKDAVELNEEPRLAKITGVPQQENETEQPTKPSKLN